MHEKHFLWLVLRKGQSLTEITENYSPVVSAIESPSFGKSVDEIR